MNMLEALRKLITQQTNTVGSVVSNIHGGVPRAFQSPELLVESTWGYAEVPDIPTLSLEDFYAILATQNQATLTGLTTVDGTLTVPDGDRRVFLLLGSFSTPSPRTINLTFDTGDSALAQVAIYKDWVLERRGQGVLTLPLVVDAGTHTIAIVCYGRTATLTAPVDLAFTMTEPEPAAPVWYDLTSQYLDQAVGTMQNVLSWQVDPKVGGWHVYRRNRKTLGKITAVTTQDGTSDFVVKITGSFEADLPLGAQLFASLMFLGSVRETSYDGTSTTVLVRPTYQDGLLSTTGSVTDWVGLNALSGVFTPIATIRRTQATGIASWADAQVSATTSYDYVLQSYGLFDPTAVSAYSDIRTVVSNDRTPPASVTSLVATALNKRVTLKFHTPSDADYAGVRVYFASEVTGTVTAGGASTLTDTAKTFNATYVGWSLRNTHSSGISETRTVSAGSGNTLTVSAPWSTAPVAGETYKVSTTTLLATDYGLPDSDDQLVFEPTAGYGTYYVIAFDMAGNEQAFDGAASFTYSAAIDTYSDGYPNAEPRVAVSTNQDTADLYVKLTTNVAESIRLFVKDSEAAGAAVWGLVASGSDSTPRYVASGTELGPTDWFHNGTSFGQILNDIALTRDNLVRRYLKATGQYSGLSSTWSSVALNTKGQPWLESVDLSWDEATDRLLFKAVAGASVQSVKFEVADNSSFTSPLLTTSQNMTDGTFYTAATSALTAGQRGKLYYARATPYNGALSGGNPTGLAGVAQQDTEFVPSSELGIDNPTATIDLDYTATNNASTATIKFNGAVGTGGTAPLQWAYKVVLDNAGTDPGFGAWQSTTLPQSITVTRDAFYKQTVYLQVKDAGGRLSSVVTCVVAPKRPMLNADGTLRRVAIYDDGGYATKSSTTDGLRIDAAVGDNSARAINRFLGKALSGDADTLDGVPEGTTYKRVTATGKTALFSRAPSNYANVLFNPGFEDDLKFWASTAGVTAVTDSTKAYSGNKYMQISSSVSRSSQQIDDGSTTRYFEVQPGQVIQWGGAVYRESGDGNCRITLGVVDKDLASVAFNPGTNGNTAAWTAVSNEYTIPSNGKYVYIYCEMLGMTTLTVARFDDVFLKILPATNDLLPGQLRSGVNDSGSRAINRFLGKALSGDADTLDGVPEGSTYKRVISSRVSSGKPVIDFTEAIHLNKTLDNIADGSSYSRVAASDMSGNRVAKLITVDTRSVNDPPSAYATGITTELKSRSTIGAPGSATYGTLVTEKQWGDSSGGSATQTFKSADGVFKREGPCGGTLTSDWGSWRYAIEANTQRIDRTTGHLTSDMQESGGKAVNRFLGKALAGDADTLDGVPNGTTYKLVKAGATDGAGNVDFSGSAFANKTFDYVARGSTNHPLVDYQSGELTIDNGNFEAAATAAETVPGWTPSGSTTLSLDTTTAYSGSKSLKVVTTVQFGSAAHRRRFRVVPGDLYKVGGAMKSLSSGYTVEVQLQFMDGSGAYLGGVNTQTTSTTWTYVNGTIGAVPANAVWAQLICQIDGASGGTGWFDSVTAMRVRDASNAEMARGGGNATSIGTIMGQLADTGHLSATMQESGGKAVNRFLGKALAGDADSLDGAPDGTTYKKVVGVASGLITPSSSQGRFRCLVYKSGASQTIADATTTALTFDAESFDIGSLHDTVTNSTRVTVPTGGTTGAWMLIARVGFAIGGSAVLEVAIRKNGTTALGKVACPAVPSGTGYGNLTILQVVGFDTDPSVGDFYEVTVTHYGTGTSQSVQSGLASTSFSAIHNW